MSDTRGIVENIVSLDRFRPRRKMNALRLVEGYWSALRTGGDLPKRSQVHPRALTDVLAHVFILERVAPGVARFRVAGAQLTKLAGMEVRGMPMSAFFRTTGRHSITTALEACFDRPAVVEASLSARSLKLGPEVDGQMILLPMQSDLGGVSRILGAIQMSDRLVSKAYRMTLNTCEIKSIYPNPMPRPGPRTPIAARDTRAVVRQRLELVHSADPR